MTKLLEVLYIYKDENLRWFIFLAINNCIFFIKIKNFVKNLLSVNWQ